MQNNRTVRSHEEGWLFDGVVAYRDDQICAVDRPGNMPTIVCTHKTGGYVVGLNRWVVMVVNANGKTVFKRANTPEN